MKITSIDCAWVAASWIAIVIGYHYRILAFSLFIAYALMVLTFLYHIRGIKKRISSSEAAVGTVTGYSTEKGSRLKYPIVTYDTAEGRHVTSIYSKGDKTERCEAGSEELICYDPADPMFFYFQNRENELTDVYFKCIIYGAVAAAALIVASLIIFGF